jgi:F-type H+-transporting ATPase subunit delta
MGSATTHALAVTNAALGDAPGVDLEVAGELFQAARVLGSSAALAGAVSDSAAAADARRKVIADVFGPRFSSVAVQLLETVVVQRWSSADELVDGVEELAVRAASVAASGTDLEGELFAFSRTVAENPELELALGSRMGDNAAKGTLVEKLLDGRVSAATVLVVSSLVQQPRERRVRQALARALSLVASQRGRVVATVTVAVPLSAAQSERLRDSLSARYGADVSLSTVIDPSIVGGLRVQIADDVIDASVSARLADLRQRLAG